MKNYGRFFCGVGSRKAIKHPEVLEEIGAISTKLRDYGWILRSGYATGCDQAFCKPYNPRKGTGYLYEIFNPEPLNSLPDHENLYHDAISFVTSKIDPRAFQIAKKIHPKWNAMNFYGKKCHARNCHQVLGASLDQPANLLICWTPGGEITGGTATAIKLALQSNIPVINMGKEDWRQDLDNYLSIRR